MDETRLRPLVVAVAVVALLAQAGCYSYSPVETGTPEPGAEVRLLLTPAGARMAAEQTRAAESSRIQGRLESVGEDSLTVRVGTAVREPALGARASTPGTRYTTVSLPDSVVRAVETRTLSPWKTGGLAAGGALALRLFLELPDVIGGGGSGPIDRPPGGQPAVFPFR